MTKKHSKRILYYFLITLSSILIFFLVLRNTGLTKSDSVSEFSFNPQSEYWPTNGWKTSTPEKQGMNSKTLVKLFEEIKNENLNINSLLVVRNGYIVVEANRYHSELLHFIYSSTKSVASAVFGIALAKGHIKSVDQSLQSFFPDFLQSNDQDKKAAITLKHLLTMSCGFEWPEVQLGYLNTENPAIEMHKSRNTVQYILNKPVNQQPGQIFNYNSGCSHLLTAVLSRTGLDVVDFAHNHLFKPLGISHYNWNRDSTGIPDGAGGLDMRTRDIAKIGYLYLKGGNWDSNQLIPTEWIKESTKKQIKMTWGGHVADYYGYQWYVQPFGFNSLGYKGQYIFLIPSQEIVAVFTSDLPAGKRTAPIDLVTSFIIPAVMSSKPIPENEEAHITLGIKSKNFEIY